MTNRKNYNSILFLTVYLGLVLVGGSSQVFAHAASNVLFELRNEIEFKEDLENKPDDSCVELKAKTDEKDNQFIAEYVNLVSAALKDYSPNLELGLIGGIHKTDLPSLSKNLSISYSQLKSDKDGFLSELTFDVSPVTKKTTPYPLALNQSIRLKTCKPQNVVEKVIAENTRISSSKNQIFIVTRLPRAAIDSLLK